MPLKTLALDVGPAGAGKTVSATLRESAGISHSVARGLVDQGLVLLNGRAVTDPARRLAAGDRIEASFDPKTRYHQKRAAAPTSGFKVLLEDDQLVVVEKQAGLLTVPSPGHQGESLADRIVKLYLTRGFKTPRLWVVHRIDRFTSGLVLFAKQEPAAASLVAQFQRRTARREYLAICEGVPHPPEGRLVSWLAQNPKSLKVRQTKDRARGQRAVCTYRTEEVLTRAALLRVTLETGRRNQIRVQLSEIKHPIVGDRSYGRPSPLIARAALHAARLGFVHPANLLPVRVECPLPADMRKLLRRLRRTPSPP